MNKYDVFISFSFENQEIVNNVVNELTNKYGISCWLCLDKISEGQSYKEKIPEAIDHSSAMVVFVSKDSIVSEQVPKEVGMAFEAGKTVIPFRLDNAKYQGKLRYDLQDVNYIDATIPTFEERVNDLAKAICFAANKPFEYGKDSALTQKDSDKFNERKTDVSNSHSTIIRETDATPDKKERQRIKYWFVNLINLLIASPVLISIINNIYPGIYEKLPAVFENVFSVFCNKWILFAYYIIVFIIAYYHIVDFEHQKKEHRYHNIDSEFSGAFQTFINKLMSLSNANLPLKQINSSKGFSDKFSLSYNFGQMRVASITGAHVDYFSVIYPIYTNPFCRFFYIGRYTSKKNAVKYLIKQGFNFCGKSNNVLHFCKDSDLHLRIACRRFVPGILGLEVVHGNVESDLEKRIKDEYEYLSPKTMVSEYKKTSKKEKIVVWSLLLFFVSLLCLGVYLKTIDMPHDVELDSNVYQTDTVPPSITLSEPSFNTDSLKSGSIEFTVLVEEDSEFVSININDDTVETVGFTADMDVVDQGETQILRFTNVEKTADECYLTLLEGVAKDAANNKSEICNSQKFSYNTVFPTMTLSPKDKDKIVKEGDTATYLVAVSDDEFIIGASVRKEDIRMYGFIADITISKRPDTDNVWEITFSDIKFNNESDAKYFEISEGIAVDWYGNISRSHRLPLKTE